MSNRAVIVGVNHYLMSPYDSLRGCVTDAQNFNLLAQNYLGYKPDEVTLLLDYQALARVEKTAIEKAVLQAGPGDKILWTHSSHGTNNPDPSQADGMQELLCCHDTTERSGIWDIATVISAKFIGDIITQLDPKAYMDIILDCCFAPQGNQLKAMGRSYAKSRFLWKEFTNQPTKTLQTSFKMPPNVCLWSACESHQTSADDYIDGRFQGAFSAAWRKFFKPGIIRNDIIYRARKWLRENRYEQIPHLYGIDLAGNKLL